METIKIKHCGHGETYCPCCNQPKDTDFWQRQRKLDAILDEIHREELKKLFGNCAILNQLPRT